MCREQGWLGEQGEREEREEQGAEAEIETEAAGHDEGGSSYPQERVRTQSQAWLGRAKETRAGEAEQRDQGQTRARK